MLIIRKEQMRKAIHFGTGQTFSHGFNFRGPVRLYLELMVLFGSHFDTDPQYPWAARILADHDGNRPYPSRQNDRAYRSLAMAQTVPPNTSKVGKLAANRGFMW